MTAVLDRTAPAVPRPELLPALGDADLSGAERVARALDHENSGAELGALVIAGRCLMAGYFDGPGDER